jgi:D-glycero-alpha-D-manno-heptose-7-phosphate kinase
VRSTFNWAQVSDGLEIHHDGDLPARSGLGSSSAFTVGLVNALYAMRGEMVTQQELATNALHIEQDLIGENVGSQDQISAAFGGFNRIDFHRDGGFNVIPLIIPAQRLLELKSHLMLCFTGFSRIADAIAKSKIDNFKNRENELKFMHQMVDEAISLMANTSIPIEEFGKLLDKSWQYKRNLSSLVSSPEIDQIYDTAMAAGAVGGKILGAGGGGFMLLFAKPEKHSAIRKRLDNLVHVDFDFDNSGSKVVLYQTNGL